MNFNPRSPYGERQLPYRIPDGGLVISIHAPLTGSDGCAESAVGSRRDFNPRSPYGERLSRTVFWRQYQRISIHAPLTGSDRVRAKMDAYRRISIHAPLTGSDFFQHCLHLQISHFNPRSPYGERLYKLSLFRGLQHFNPRSPYGERLNDDLPDLESLQFQSTLPLRGATARLHKILLRFLFK